MELALPTYSSFRTGLLYSSCEYGWQLSTERSGARFWAKGFRLGSTKPNKLPPRYIMVVSGKKSNLELKGPTSASVLKKQRLPPSSQPQYCRMCFCGSPLPLNCEHLPAVSIIPVLKESRVVLAGIAETPSLKDCLPSTSEAEMGEGRWICKETIQGKVVTNFQYLAQHFQAVREVEGNCEFCLSSFVLERGAA